MEKGKKNKKQVIIGVSILLLVTLLLLGLTYAYYRTRIIGNTNSESISVTSKNLEVTYKEGNGLINNSGNKIEPGYTESKTFNVENTGDSTATYNIIFDNLVNTFNRGEDWTYELKKEGQDEPISSGSITNKFKKQLLIQETIDSEQINNYSLTVRYASKEDEDQSVDMGATLSLRVNISGVDNNIFENEPQDTLLYAIGRDNNVLNPITIPGREVAKYEYVEIVDGDPESSTIIDGSKYFTYGMEYSFDKTSGKYTISGVEIKQLSELVNIVNGSSENKIYVGNINGKDTNDNNNNDLILYAIYHIAKIEITDEGKYKVTYKRTYGTRRGTEAELSYTEDDYGTSYYYRGAVENNFLNFGGMCWKIVRIQGNGSIKIILSDKNNTCDGPGYSPDDKNSASISLDQPFNSDSSKIKIVNYADSDIRTVVDEWYQGETFNEGKKYIDDQAEWCIDVSETSTISGGTSGTTTRFGALDRLYPRSSGVKNASPNLKCDFEGNNGTHSEKYRSGVALLSADEVAFAGSIYGESCDDCLVDEPAFLDFWTLSPCDIDRNCGTIFYVSRGQLDNLIPTQHQSSYAARPALVLKSTTPIIPGGDGTQQHPYTVQSEG